MAWPLAREKFNIPSSQWNTDYRDRKSMVFTRAAAVSSARPCCIVLYSFHTWSRGRWRCPSRESLLYPCRIHYPRRPSQSTRRRSPVGTFRSCVVCGIYAPGVFCVNLRRKWLRVVCQCCIRLACLVYWKNWWSKYVWYSMLEYFLLSIYNLGYTHHLSTHMRLSVQDSCFCNQIK